MKCVSQVGMSFQVPDISRAMELGQEAAQHVSTTFIKPIRLEFEKVRVRAPAPEAPAVVVEAS